MREGIAQNAPSLALGLWLSCSCVYPVEGIASSKQELKSESDATPASANVGTWWRTLRSAARTVAVLCFKKWRYGDFIVEMLYYKLEFRR